MIHVSRHDGLEKATRCQADKVLHEHKVLHELARARDTRNHTHTPVYRTRAKTSQRRSLPSFTMRWMGVSRALGCGYMR